MHTSTMLLRSSLIVLMSSSLMSTLPICMLLRSIFALTPNALGVLDGEVFDFFDNRPHAVVRSVRITRPLWLLMLRLRVRFQPFTGEGKQIAKTPAAVIVYANKLQNFLPRKTSQACDGILLRLPKP